MSEDSPLGFPDITDDDIRWASGLLKLPDIAFFGTDGADPRREVLKDMSTIDVVACPGSGKTTLLVAKLAILAEKWRCRTRGICVLSHTNVARNEIETRLGNTTAGRRLLSYPHFIGTIHGFVNEFIALPFLRSHGYSKINFNTDISGNKLWKLSNYGREMPNYIYRKINNVEHRKTGVQRAYYKGEDLDIILETANNCVPLLRKKASEAFKVLNKWKLRVLQDGFAAYELKLSGLTPPGAN